MRPIMMADMQIPEKRFCEEEISGATSLTTPTEPTGSITRQIDLIERVAKCDAEITESREAVEVLHRTEQRLRAEEKLQESEAYLAEAQRLSHTGSWAWAPGTGELRYWSEECYRVLGFDLHGGQPRFETFFQRIHPDDQARVRETSETAAREKVGFEKEYRIVHPGGEIRNIHTVGRPVFSLSGDLVEFVGTVLDVTARTLAQALRDGESRILAMIARDAPRREILERLVLVVEGQFTGLLCSGLLLDEDWHPARHGPAPTLPHPHPTATTHLC